MKKVTKTQVKALMNRLEIGETLSVWLCPSNARPNPGHPFNMAILVKLERDGEWWPEMKEYRDLDTIVNSFHYHNCNHEAGTRVHYYIEEGEK
jgi:hypothetical protein